MLKCLAYFKYMHMAVHADTHSNPRTPVQTYIHYAHIYLHARTHTYTHTHTKFSCKLCLPARIILVHFYGRRHSAAN
jgi:hypothetical protein